MVKKNFLKTEDILSRNNWIDQLDLTNAIKLIIKNQTKSIIAIKKASFEIENCINLITKKLKDDKGSLVYIGAGSSGRLGVLDGSEIPPTFGWNKNKIKFILSGGKKAMFRSSEGAEDDTESAIQMLKKNKISKNDVIIGLSASGKTKFTLSGINYANKIGCLTIGITNNKDTIILEKAKLPICLDTGAEVVAGSTRMCAGTAQKICLNIISTMVMSNLGKVKNGMMIAMNPSNDKLKDRHKRIKKLISET